MKFFNIEYNCDKKLEILLKIISVISCPFYTLLISNRYLKLDIILSMTLSFIIFLIISVKILKIKKINIYKLILSIIFYITYIIELYKFSYRNINFLKPIVPIIKDLYNIELSRRGLYFIISILAFPFTILIIYKFIDFIISKIKIFFASLSKIEKKYLVIFTFLSLIISIFITTNTTAFTFPIYNSSNAYCDVIYTADSGMLLKGNGYVNASFMENDIRQPLFGIFALPFSLPALLVSNVLKIFSITNGYYIILMIIQFTILAITTIMLSRMLDISEHEKKYFYLLTSVSFPYMLFSMVLEQYAIALFYLVLLIYNYYNNKDKTNYAYVGAVGTLLTSGILFPLISNIKNIKNYLINVLKCFILFISVLIIGGQFPQLINAPNTFTHLIGDFTTKVTLIEKIFQFTHFVKEIFIASPGIIKFTTFPSYQLINFNSVSIIGIAFILICIISFVLNRDKYIARICFSWVIFSILILLIIGWGTSENGLVLYSLYFAFAYLILYFLFIKRAFKNKMLYKSIIVLSSIIMFIFNIKEIISIISFGLKYY